MPTDRNGELQCEMRPFLFIQNLHRLLLHHSKICKLKIYSMAAKITMGSNGKLNVPNNPTIPFIEGDGIGPEVWAASKLVLDAAVAKAYKGERKIDWKRLYNNFSRRENS
jgi:hypothetical protein